MEINQLSAAINLQTMEESGEQCTVVFAYIVSVPVSISFVMWPLRPNQGGNIFELLIKMHFFVVVWIVSTFISPSAYMEIVALPLASLVVFLLSM